MLKYTVNLHTENVGFSSSILSIKMLRWDILGLMTLYARQILKLFVSDSLQRTQRHIPFKLLKTNSSFLIVTDALTSASAK